MVGTPVWFAREVLKLQLYPWQERVLWDVAVGSLPVALAAANGSGKTQMVAAPLLLWHCAAFPGSVTVTTAGVFRQVKEQLWGALRQFHPLLGSGWQVNATDLTAPNGSRAVGFSTDDPGKFEGWHNDNLLMILDEAKTIPDAIINQVERCQPTRRLLMSSCAGLEGEFAAAFHQRRKFYSQHRVTSYDCPHLKREWIEQQIEKWGRNHPLVRSMIFSEFVEDSASMRVLSKVRLMEVVENPPEWKPSAPVAFIDWAAGGDENAVAIVAGNKLLPIEAWRERDTTLSVDRTQQILVKHGVEPGRIFADDGGLGHPCNDLLASKYGINVKRVHANAAAFDTAHYHNMTAELWLTAARLIDKGDIILPDDDVLVQQMSDRMIVSYQSGKVGVEKKEDMRLRGVTSPDRADAALAAITLADKLGYSHEWIVTDEAAEDATIEDSTPASLPWLALD